MTQDEIIEMARQSGFMPAHDNRVQHFAKLVAAKQREESASFIEELDERGFKELAGLIRAGGEA